MLTASFMVNASAGENQNVSDEIKVSFETKFHGIENVSWSKYNDIQVATFKQDGEIYRAYYTEDGEIAAMGRIILKDNLPLVVKNSYKKIVSNHTVASIEEVVVGLETFYYVHLENEKQKLFVRIYSGGDVEVCKKVRKG